MGYYLNIIEQMGYTLVYSDDGKMKVIRKSDQKELDRVLCDEEVKFCDSENDFEILFEKYRIIVRKGDTVMGLHQTDELYAFHIFDSKDKDKEKLMVHIEQYDEEGEGELAYFAIGVGISDVPLNIHQMYNGGLVNNIKDYGEEDYLKISRRIPVDDCTTDNYVRIILDYFNSQDSVKKSLALQEGLRLITPSLCMVTDNVITYWKTLGIARLIQAMRGKEEKNPMYFNDLLALQEQFRKGSNSK